MTMILTAERIQQIAVQSAQQTNACACIRGLSRGWETLPNALAAEGRLRLIGNVADDGEDHQNLDEYHPRGTHFWSTEAPICFGFYPYNRCSIWGCTECSRTFLRFTEAGAYHAERRIRILDPALITLMP